MNERTKEMYSFMCFYTFSLNYIKKSGIIKGDCINNNKKYESRGEINMKKTNLVKVFSILLISVMVMLFTTTVNGADDNTGYNDLTSTLTNGSANNNSNNSSNNSSNNTNVANNASNNTANNTNKTNNSSIYNNTNLPKTGIGDSIPVAMLVVIFGISAVYAYKKIKEYKNI